MRIHRMQTNSNTHTKLPRRHPANTVLQKTLHANNIQTCTHDKRRLATEKSNTTTTTKTRKHIHMQHMQICRRPTLRTGTQKNNSTHIQHMRGIPAMRINICEACIYSRWRKCLHGHRKSLAKETGKCPGFTAYIFDCNQDEIKLTPVRYIW
jgi:hypothetical protein